MKKSALFGGVAVAAAAAAGGYFLLRPTATAEDVKTSVDTQYEELSILLNDLEAKVQQPEANIDSLTLVLEAVEWAPVKDGGDYEAQKRNLYLDAKKNVVMRFYQVLIERHKAVDTQYEELSILLNDLEVKVKQPEANIDSLTLVLEAVRWTPVKDDGDYDTQKRNLYLDAKKNVAMSFREEILKRGEEITNPFLDDVEAIKE
jgi:hypothetical protein